MSDFDRIAAIVTATFPSVFATETPNLGYQDGPALFLKDRKTGQECMVSVDPNDDPEDDAFYAEYAALGLGPRVPHFLVDGFNREDRTTYLEATGKTVDETAAHVIDYFNRI